MTKSKSRVQGSIEMEHGEHSVYIVQGRVKEEFYVSIEFDGNEDIQEHSFPTEIEAQTFYFLFIGKLNTEGWR